MVKGWRSDWIGKQLSSYLPYQRLIKRIGTRYQFCVPWIYNQVVGRYITMITTMEELNCIDSSWFIFNCSFRFGVLSDFMRRIFWLLEFSFANLKNTCASWKFDMIFYILFMLFEHLIHYEFSWILFFASAICRILSCEYVGSCSLALLI